MAVKSSNSISGRIKELTGKRFGRLVVTEFSGREDSRALWECKCDCGNITIARSKHLSRGSTKSCGCLRSEKVSQRMSKAGKYTPDERRLRAEFPLEWNSYYSMVQRCHNPGHKDFKYYGARGRKVCQRWLHGEGQRGGFELFVQDMAPRMSPHLTLDRVNNSLGYHPNNCRWATKEQQTRNR